MLLCGKNSSSRKGKKKKGYTHLAAANLLPCHSCAAHRGEPPVLIPLPWPGNPGAAVHPSPLDFCSKIFKCTHLPVCRKPGWKSDPKCTDLGGHSPENMLGYGQESTCLYKHRLVAKHNCICSQGIFKDLKLFKWQSNLHWLCKVSPSYS